MRREIQMLLLAASSVALTPGLAAQALSVVRAKAGMVITRSVKIAPGSYLLAPRRGDSVAITVRGDGIRVELTGVTLRGTPDGTDPDQRTGIAVLIDGGKNVTVAGGRIEGYQTGIRAVGTTDLTLHGIDLSDNWRPRLFSELGHESLIDWLSFHHNENGEWRRFGAGIALEGVHRGTISGNTVRHGMNGLMLSRSDSLRIDTNDFSFNSGVGIGLYRSTDNSIVSNRADYNVRGFSRYYRRGQDSADLLMFEQSSRNVVKSNSMTHGGDGLFLWAGQSTMDSGAGGSNDNRFQQNDFSYAPTNGMEATFSRNQFIKNRVVGSENGLWGGYSYSTTATSNCFDGNRVGIAIEHGQDNTILHNRFSGDSTAISIWADSITPSDWGYPKHRDTRSRDWTIAQNRFEDGRVALRVRQTIGLRGDNLVGVVDTAIVARDTSAIAISFGLISTATSYPDCAPPTVLHAESDAVDADRIPTSEVALRPRSAIIIDQWGPYDWSTPKLWPIDSSTNAPLQVLGPSGRWKVVGHLGLLTLSRDHGTSGDTIAVTPAPGHAGTWRLDLADSAGRRFSFERFEPLGDWEVDYLPAPGGNVSWNAPPLLSRREPRLDKMSYGPPAQGIPATDWGLTAATEVDLAPGTYTVRAISDDGIRVWVDGQVVIDNWKPHESLVDAVPLAGGHHGIVAQYRQIDGWMELRVEILRGWVPSTGSPGPH